MNSNLFKEAIADAKAVRQTALANAKVALEEAFSERYQKMFAEKLREETEEECATPDMDTPDLADECGSGCNTEELDELIAELESEVEDSSGTDAGATAPPANAGDMGAPEAGTPSVGAAPAVCPPGTIPCPGAPGGQPIPQGPSPMGGEQNFGAGAPPPPPMGGEQNFGAGAPPPPPMGGEQNFGAGAPPPPPMGGEQNFGAGAPPPPPENPQDKNEMDEVDLDELLESLEDELRAEYEKEEGEVDDPDMPEIPENVSLYEQTKLASSGIGGGVAGGSPNKRPTTASSSTSRIESDDTSDEGFPSIEQSKKISDAARPNRGPRATKTNLSTPSMGGGDGYGGQSETGMPNIGQPKVTKDSRPNTISENLYLKQQLSEAENVIRYVKGQLNEVNLLNAKLLYTNKLYKQYNMNNEQKMRIIEMFDLAKNIREVKLTYANITEALNFGGKEVKKKVNTASSVQSITEGLASGVVASTKPKAIITEGKFASRMKQLAGIRSEPTKK
jgi:hypothetical protein